MAKNNGLNSERIFDLHFQRRGAHVYSFTDTRALRGAGGTGFTSSRPSDRIVTLDGQTFYAEVKSTTGKKSFAFSLIQSFQLGSCERILKAGGKYFFFVHRLPENVWYTIPGDMVAESGKRSIKFSDIEKLKWSVPE